jgi:hypothetical protein
VARLKRAEVAILALGVALVLPALGGGFFIDDYLQIANLEDWGPYHPAPLDLYRFVPSDPADTEDFIAAGVLPWWSASDLALGFWRPLASGMLSVEHALWGRMPLPRHVHSILWLVVMLGAAATIVRRHLPPALATLALLLFAVEDSHAMSVGWIAGRHAIMAAALVWLGLTAHIAFRTRGWRPGGWLGPVACGLGLLAGETAVPAMAYLLAWELCERRPRWQRALLPYVLLVLAYAVAQGVAEAGVRGSGGYLDPRSEPGAFVAALPGRLLVMFANLSLGLPADLLSFEVRLEPLMMALGLLCLLGGVVWGRQAYARLPPEERQPVRWLGLGAALTLLPAAAAMPGERVLLPTTLGASVVFAVLLRDGWRRRAVDGRAARLGVFAGLALLGVPNLVLSPLFRVGKTASLRWLSRRTQEIVRSAELDANFRFDAVVIHSEDLQVGYLPIIRRFDGASGEQLRAGLAAATAGAADAHSAWGPIRSFRVLSMAATDHVLRRTDPHTLELETPHGTLLDGGWASLYRSRTRPLPTGTIVPLVGLEVEVLADREGLPTRVAFRFEKRLEDSELRFLQWKDGTFRRFDVPWVGQEVAVKRGPPFFPGR